MKQIVMLVVMVLALVVGGNVMASGECSPAKTEKISAAYQTQLNCLYEVLEQELYMDDHSKSTRAMVEGAYGKCKPEVISFMKDGLLCNDKQTLVNTVKAQRAAFIREMSKARTKQLFQ